MLKKRVSQGVRLNFTYFNCILTIFQSLAYIPVKILTWYSKEDFLVLIIFFVFTFCPLYTVHYIQLILLMLTLKFPAVPESNQSI